MASSSNTSVPSDAPSAIQIREKEQGVREVFSRIPPYAHANTPSVVTPENVQAYRSEFHFSGEYVLRAPSAEERMYWKPSGPAVAISTQVLKYGVRLPLPPFISDFLEFVGISLAQLVPNSYIYLVCYIAACKKFGIEPALDYFFHLFHLTKSKEHGFRTLNKVQGQRVWMTPPSSNKGWHSNWFYVSGPDTHLIPSWNEPEKPPVDPLTGGRKKEFTEFCKAIPKEPWDLGWLSNQQWLYDHGCKCPNPFLLLFAVFCFLSRV